MDKMRIEGIKFHFNLNELAEHISDLKMRDLEISDDELWNPALGVFRGPFSLGKTAEMPNLYEKSEDIADVAIESLLHKELYHVVAETAAQAKNVLYHIFRQGKCLELVEIQKKVQPLNVIAGDDASNCMSFRTIDILGNCAWDPGDDNCDLIESCCIIHQITSAYNLMSSSQSALAKATSFALSNKRVLRILKDQSQQLLYGIGGCDIVGFLYLIQERNGTVVLSWMQKLPLRLPYDVRKLLIYWTEGLGNGTHYL